MGTLCFSAFLYCGNCLVTYFPILMFSMPLYVLLLPHLARHPSSRAQAASHGNNKARIFISRVFMLLGHDTEAAGYKVHLAFQNFRYAHHEMGYVESIAT
jgi:hypothetical protein